MAVRRRERRRWRGKKESKLPDANPASGAPAVFLPDRVGVNARTTLLADAVANIVI